MATVERCGFEHAIELSESQFDFRVHRQLTSQTDGLGFLSWLARRLTHDRCECVVDVALARWFLVTDFC